MPYSTSVQSCAIALRSAASERSTDSADIHQIFTPGMGLQTNFFLSAPQRK